MCATTTEFSVFANGNSSEYFEGQMGLWQGDPVSPFLFTLVMEVLRGLLKKGKSINAYDWHTRCRRIEMTHLCFADDYTRLC